MKFELPEGVYPLRTNISKRLRFKIMHRDNFRCTYCGATSSQTTLVIDHIIPVAKGGATNPENLVTACHDCNAGKSDLSISVVHPKQIEFEDYLWECAQTTVEMDNQQDLEDAWASMNDIDPVNYEGLVYSLIEGWNPEIN